MKTLVYPHEPGCWHAEGPSGDDRTLCGLTLEADSVVGIFDSAQERIGRVSCPDCIEIIDFCRKLPSTWRYYP